MRKIIGCFFFLIWTGIFLISNSCGAETKRNADPNIVVIVIDTLRADHLPFYGHNKLNAPFLSILARESFIFKNTFSASSWTTPSTASIFTSLYPFQHGVMVGFRALKQTRKKNPEMKINRIPEEILTLPEILQEQGYDTYGISDNLNVCEAQGFAQGFNKFETFSYSRATNVNKKIAEWQGSILKSKKYFLYVHYMDPHKPYYTENDDIKDHVKDTELLSAYDREIGYVDKHIQDLYQRFAWDKNTMLIITSDHGEAMKEHGHLGHAKTLYNEEINVPMIIKLPGQNSGTVLTGNFSTIDILPTLCDFIGADFKQDFSGISLLPFMENLKENTMDRYIFANLLCQVGPKKGRGVDWKATIHQNWHYLTRSPVKNGTKEELYNIKNDILESENLIHSRPFILKKLRGALINFIKKCVKYKQQNITLQLKKKKAEQLKSLGYI